VQQAPRGVGGRWARREGAGQGPARLATETSRSTRPDGSFRRKSSSGNAQSSWQPKKQQRHRARKGRPGQDTLGTLGALGTPLGRGGGAAGQRAPLGVPASQLAVPPAPLHPGGVPGPGSGELGRMRALGPLLPEAGAYGGQRIYNLHRRTVQGRRGAWGCAEEAGARSPGGGQGGEQGGGLGGGASSAGS